MASTDYKINESKVIWKANLLDDEGESSSLIQTTKLSKCYLSETGYPDYKTQKEAPQSNTGEFKCKCNSIPLFEALTIQTLHTTTVTMTGTSLETSTSKNMFMTMVFGTLSFPVTKMTPIHQTTVSPKRV